MSTYTSGELSIRVVTVELAQAVLALLIGLACYAAFFWMASRFLGIDVRAEISFTESPVEATAIFVIIIALMAPVVFLAYGLSLIAVRPFLQADDYDNLVNKALKSPGFGPLKRFLLGSSKQDADGA